VGSTGAVREVNQLLGAIVLGVQAVVALLDLKGPGGEFRGQDGLEVETKSQIGMEV
jgi:hypothetical protein